MTSQLCPKDTAPVYNDASSLTTTSAARVTVCPKTLLQGIYHALCSSQNSLRTLTGVGPHSWTNAICQSTQ